MIKFILKMIGVEEFVQYTHPPKIPVIGHSETAGDIELIQRIAQVPKRDFSKRKKTTSFNKENKPLDIEKVI